jgi:hypothetical protein
MKVFAHASQALEQVLGKGGRVPTRGLEALLLAQSMSVDGGLVFKVERDRAENLGESQSFEFRQDRSGESLSLKH